MSKPQTGQWCVEELGGGVIRVVPYSHKVVADFIGSTEEEALRHYISGQDQYIERQLLSIKEARRDRANAVKLLSVLRKEKRDT
jgi:hypothetical protein